METFVMYRNLFYLTPISTIYMQTLVKIFHPHHFKCTAFNLKIVATVASLFI
jgi:hypothetical protein